MFNTIKSRILILTLSIFFMLAMVSAFLIHDSYKQNARLKIEALDYNVLYFIEKLNRSVSELNKSASDLATMGEIFYFSSDRVHKNLDLIVQENFLKDEIAAGGGIFFEPYMVRADKDRFCSYGFKDGKKVKIDKYYEGSRYDYLDQKWYKEIKNGLLKGNTNVWSSPYKDQLGTNSVMITSGTGLWDYNNNLIGIATVDWKLDRIIEKISSFKPTDGSFAIFFDLKTGHIIASSYDKDIKENINEYSWYKKGMVNMDEFRYNDNDYIFFTSVFDNGLALILNVQKKDLYDPIFKKTVASCIFLLISSLIIAITIYIMLLKNINKPVDYMKSVAEEIGVGDLDKKIDISSPMEFKQLAECINKMTGNLKDYIQKIEMAELEKRKLSSELGIARTIQYSSLPAIFPPYPEREDFDIYASMQTAKDVGGDFYDFFFIDSDNLVILTADVSGKGIPAALFMMTAKTLIKNLAKTKMPIEDLIFKVNNSLCKSNKQGFFVTLFYALVDLKEGKVYYINAGHNPPLLRSDGKFKYIDTESNIALGVVENFIFQSSEFSIKKDDLIFLYTDGVTEAMNSQGVLYGAGNLLDALNKAYKTFGPKKYIEKIKKDIEDYTQGAEQTDDITMLALIYNGPRAEVSIAETFILRARTDLIKNLFRRAEKLCAKLDMRREDASKLNIAIDEIFSNISKYAYKDSGDVELFFKADEKHVEITFTDTGIPYNPLDKEDPDINLPAEERPEGGLGIYMVKNLMENIVYERKDDRNILKISMNYKRNAKQ